MYSVILADDHPLLLGGLQQSLLATPDINVVGVAANGEDALALIHDLKPDIAVLDVAMPQMSGLDVLRASKDQRLRLKVILLTATISGAQIADAISRGAWGILLKEYAPEALLDCLRHVASGEKWLPAELVAKASEAPPVAALNKIELLTAREREIAALICGGCPTERSPRSWVHPKERSEFISITSIASWRSPTGRRSRRSMFNIWPRAMGEGCQPSQSRFGATFRIGLGVAAGAAFIVLVVRDVHLPEVWALLQNAALAPLLFAFLAFVTDFLLRALRFWMILKQTSSRDFTTRPDRGTVYRQFRGERRAAATAWRRLSRGVVQPPVPDLRRDRGRRDDRRAGSRSGDDRGPGSARHGTARPLGSVRNGVAFRASLSSSLLPEGFGMLLAPAFLAGYLRSYCTASNFPWS